MATLTAHADLLVGDHTLGDARSFALAAATAWRCGVSNETLVLLVDELVAAVRERADAEHGLVLELVAHEAQGLRVTLADGRAVRATAADVVRGAPHLSALLTSLTVRWGDEPYRGGYCLWFELGQEDPHPRGGPLRPDEPDADIEVEAFLRRHRATSREPALDASTAARLAAWTGPDRTGSRP
jgi:hypothetical protein